MLYNLHNDEWKMIKSKVRKRDNYKCQICGIFQDELNGRHKKLDVHHRIPFRISQDNRLSNLISCCVNCHGSQETNNKILENMKIAGHPSRIEDYIPPKWHLWVYGGGKNPHLAMNPF